MVDVARRNRALRIIELLQATYPAAHSTLRAQTPLEILVATMLSAQSTDVQVNRVTTSLFKKYQTVEDFATANLDELQRDIYVVGYYRQKARHLQTACRILIEEFNGKVPQTMEELVRLPGVGRKTANIILNRAFGRVEGIAVDTHVFRIARRLEFSTGQYPHQVEQELMELLPTKFWGIINRLFIAHGRHLCTARNPQCPSCPVNALCPYAASTRGTK